MKSNYSLAEILSELKEAELIEFGNLEERIRKSKPHLTDYQVAHEVKYLARKQILRIIGTEYSPNDQYRLLKDYFMQKIDGEYLRLPINRKYQANFQRSKALQRLHKEGFIKMFRASGSFGQDFHLHGWKPYGVHQTYLVFNEQNSVHHEVHSV